MKSVNPRPSQDPTSSRTKTVASERERSRILRAILLSSLRSVREEVRMPTTVSDDLSSWILQLHGVTTDDASHKLEGSSSAPSVSSLTKWMATIAGPESDPTKTRARLAKLQEVKDYRTSH